MWVNELTGQVLSQGVPLTGIIVTTIAMHRYSAHIGVVAVHEKLPTRGLYHEVNVICNV